MQFKADIDGYLRLEQQTETKRNETERNERDQIFALECRWRQRGTKGKQITEKTRIELRANSSVIVRFAVRSCHGQDYYTYLTGKADGEEEEEEDDDDDERDEEE